MTAIKLDTAIIDEPFTTPARMHVQRIVIENEELRSAGDSANARIESNCDALVGEIRRFARLEIVIRVLTPVLTEVAEQ